MSVVAHFGRPLKVLLKEYTLVELLAYYRVHCDPEGPQQRRVRQAEAAAGSDSKAPPAPRGRK
jgi:hypothetical protein